MLSPFLNEDAIVNEYRVAALFDGMPPINEDAIKLDLILDMNTISC
jgi:hypothetical protein